MEKRTFTREQVEELLSQQISECRLFVDHEFDELECPRVDLDQFPYDDGTDWSVTQGPGESESRDAVETIMLWWLSLEEDYLDINEMLLCRQKLEGHLTFFANFATEAHKEYIKAKAILEERKAQIIAHYDTMGLSTAKVNQKVKIETMKETKEKARMYRAHLEKSTIVKNAESILNGMNQRIAHIRRELEYNRKHG